MAKKSKTVKTEVVSYSSRIDIPKSKRDAVIAILNQQLADSFDLYSQTKQAHWNVKGRDFIALHELFDELAQGLLDQIDTLAERITALGGSARGTARMAVASSRLSELPEVLGDSLNAVSLLADRYAALAASTRAATDAVDDIGDDGSEDLLTGQSRELDKALWLLEAHLQA